ncbi:MAG TPA: hypothetical protein VHY35_06330 [Stellaceae bacterium]|jgi:hypothetical protein|nr:hypothetical protein [Stellaceae bacterium]
MSDELTALQETATQARANADKLKSALTDQSSAKERTAAEKSEAAAVEAEAACADAKAKADAEAKAQADADAQAAADAKAKADAEAAAQTGAAPNADGSRTGFVSGVRAGEECVCPDGRKGTVHKFDEGLVCIPNHDQG